jgi:omega-amidase
MYIVLGTIRIQKSMCYNLLQLIGPNGESIGNYDKRALWGWDLDNFTKGESLGIYQIDDIQIGFRICFEIRFPEYFRELFKSYVQLCFVSFCDVSEQDLIERYGIIKSHLVTRAVENVNFYIRVSSKEQNTIRQEVKAKEYNIPMECVYIEKVSGKNVTARPILNNMMATPKVMIIY